MTRKKKTRNPGSISIKPAKIDKESDFSSKDKKPKKQTGKKPGNRQQEALKKKRPTQTGGAKKDPRIGSKKPIVLTKAAPENKTSQKAKPAKKVQTIAPIKVIETGPSIVEQLAAIENDEQLQAILDKQEDGELLTESEVSYYNEMMDKHEALADQLDDNIEEEREESEERLNEDDLWDKLDSTDLSDFE